MNGELCTSFYPLEELLDNIIAQHQALGTSPADVRAEGIASADLAACKKASALPAAAANPIAAAAAAAADGDEDDSTAEAAVSAGTSAGAGAGVGAAAGAGTAPRRPLLARQRSYRVSTPDLELPMIRGVQRPRRRVHNAEELSDVLSFKEKGSLPMVVEGSEASDPPAATVKFQVRRGDTTIEVDVPVVDLHALMPYK